jgi:hypothetical protein
VCGHQAAYRCRSVEGLLRLNRLDDQFAGVAKFQAENPRVDLFSFSPKMKRDQNADKYQLWKPPSQGHNRLRGEVK